jgi:hypothetical protein
MFSHKSVDNLTITASKFEPLTSLLRRNKKHLDYIMMERLIESIGRQLHHLETENKGISSFNLDDITVFYAADDGNDGNDGNDADADVYFAITNEDKIHDIDDEHQLLITTPYQKEYTATRNILFQSPEYKEFAAKKTIPYKVHFKSGYYSFGLLCLYCYVSRTLVAAENFEQVLAPIINTKIYWFLKWVLKEDPTERRYICV